MGGLRVLILQCWHGDLGTREHVLVVYAFVANNQLCYFLRLYLYLGYTIAKEAYVT